MKLYTRPLHPFDPKINWQENLPNESDLQSALGSNILSEEEPQGFKKVTENSPAYYLLAYGFHNFCENNPNWLQDMAKIFVLSVRQAELGKFSLPPFSFAKEKWNAPQFSRRCSLVKKIREINKERITKYGAIVSPKWDMVDHLTSTRLYGHLSQTKGG